MTSAYYITVCISNIISTASNIMIKARDTVRFAYDVTISIYMIISTASNIMTGYNDVCL